MSRRLYPIKRANEDYISRSSKSVPARLPPLVCQFVIFVAGKIGRSDVLTTLDIAVRMIEQAPGITRLLDRLEGKKFVRRERPSDNRRQVLCYITKPGLDLLQELDTPFGNKVNQALHRLDESEIEELIRLLELARGEQPSTT